MRLHHITALSNFIQGYDRYRRTYSKQALPRSTFPDKFFLLPMADISVGYEKARRLVEKLELEGDCPIMLTTDVDPTRLKADHASGLGAYIEQDFIEIEEVSWITPQGDDWCIEPLRVEDAAAASFTVGKPQLGSWSDARPRSVSILPIGLACQASCKFCFSKASVSEGFRSRVRDWTGIDTTLRAARQAGAERAVITGGGEPTLLREEDLDHLVSLCARSFPKTVLITNGGTIAGGGQISGQAMRPKTGQTAGQGARTRLKSLSDAGLSILAVSRHHHDPRIAAEIMGLDVNVTEIARALPANSPMKLRLICVLQRGGIETPDDIAAYLDWAASLGIREVNFKELYVSAGLESDYANRAANEYSASMQVPLRIVDDFARASGWGLTSRLPWGAPIFSGRRGDIPMQIAAYTEPSVFWELSNKTVRSWNHMSDGQVLASLEDMNSRINPNEFL